MRLYREEVAPRRGRYLLATACMVVVSAATSLTAWLMKDVVNQIFVSRDASMLWLISAAVAAVFVVKGAAEYLSQVILGHIGSSITASLRRRFFAQLLQQELLFFTRASSSRFVAQLIRHIDALKGTVNLLIAGLARDLLTLIGLVAVMVSQQPVLFSFAIPGVLVVVWFVGVLSSRLGAIVREEHQADVRLITAVQEAAQGIRSVKAFDLSRPLLERFEELLEQSERRANRIQDLTALTTPLTESLAGLAIAGVILYGGWRAIGAGEPPGELMAFITALLLAYEPAKRLSKLRMQLEQHLALSRSFYGFLDRKPRIVATGKALPPEAERAPLPIRFRRVSFAYSAQDGPVLRELDLTLEPGRITALCGPTGGGKSTLVDLMFRFHDPSSGRITLGDHDLRELAPAAVSRFYSFVGQDIFLFDASIGENIRLGSDGVEEERLLAAARAALLDDFVRRLPEGYETPVGEKGVRLSGGQRQRVAIARALVREAPVLVLDEATSALDPVAEQRILENVRRRHASGTIVLVSHRIAPLAIADRIVVVDDGRIVEEGGFRELVEARGAFYRLYESQLEEHDRERAVGEGPMANEAIGWRS